MVFGYIGGTCLIGWCRCEEELCSDGGVGTANGIREIGFVADNTARSIVEDSILVIGCRGKNIVYLRLEIRGRRYGDIRESTGSPFPCVMFSTLPSGVGRVIDGVCSVFGGRLLLCVVLVIAGRTVGLGQVGRDLFHFDGIGLAACGIDIEREARENVLEGEADTCAVGHTIGRL